ncbi:cupin domain-containing protein [Mucilaginibacter corticis]|uniref:Cupin domain-containing protein n=1 Tax=Mucilaginibacter corticis TaxID=2597670 RepID=A0A556MX91_9SPHI|nr:cupin domain-containing protein [Mucilaginibacter corticis]TSJ44505.1 cupin domain-containing protein [Mucilaginibacter corticis]
MSTFNPMDCNAYINNGNLEQYCFELFNAQLGNEIRALRLLHPEISSELKEIEQTIKKFALSQAIQPRPQLRNRILSAVFAEDSISLDNLPPTSKFSNYESWLKAVAHLIPAEPFDDFFAQVLLQNEQIAQTLVITKLNVPEEVHEEVAESFFILKGSCACTVGEEVFTLHAGDYLDIPLHTSHDIKILSPYVVAILQHQF